MNTRMSGPNVKDEQTCCNAVHEPALVIERIETYPLLHRLKQPYGDANGYKQYRSCYLIRIVTTAGVDGWGECIDWLPSLDVGFRQRIIPFLTGKCAANRLALVQTVKKWHQRAAAAVSMALTDIVAKWAGLSVCELWGGRLYQQIPVYASFQSYTDVPDWQAQSLENIEQALTAGFSLVKVKIGGRALKDDQSHIEKVLILVKGRAQVALDANQSYDLAAALTWRSFLERWENIAWLEEPLPLVHANVKEYSKLRQNLLVPVAGGENVKSGQDFLPYLCEGSLDIVQPDPLHVDGIEAYRGTLQLSRQFGIRCSPHTFDGGLSRLYALMAQAVLPPWSKMKGEDIEPVEWDVMENPFRKLFTVPVHSGIASLPEGIGVGCEPDMEIIRAFGWDGSMYL